MWLVSLTSLTLGCSHNSSKERTPSEQPAKKGVVIFKPPGRTVRVEVEIASDPEARRRGLMHRRELAPMAGMLFVFDEQTTQSFWMKNTYLPLDMIFIDETSKVVGIVANAEPLTRETRSVGAPSRFVVEVNAGFCKTHAISTGTPVVLPEAAARP